MKRKTDAIGAIVVPEKFLIAQWDKSNSKPDYPDKNQNGNCPAFSGLQTPKRINYADVFFQSQISQQ